MSFNRIEYDPYEYFLKLKQSTTTMDYMLNPTVHENESKCFHQLGLVGGPTVSHIRGNAVDLESELRGQTRLYSWDASKSWQRTDVEDPVIKNDKTAPIDTRKLHLQGCQMISYKSVPLPRQS